MSYVEKDLKITVESGMTGPVVDKIKKNLFKKCARACIMFFDDMPTEPITIQCEAVHNEVFRSIPTKVKCISCRTQIENRDLFSMLTNSHYQNIEPTPEEIAFFKENRSIPFTITIEVVDAPYDQYRARLQALTEERNRQKQATIARNVIIV